MGGGLLEVDTLVEELLTDMSRSSKTTFEPKEVVGLVVTAADNIFERDRKQNQFPIGAPPRMKVIAGKAPRRAAEVRRGQG